MMVTAQSMDLECRASLRTGWSILAALLLGGHMPGESIERPAGVRAPASRAMDAGIQNSLYRELRKIAAAKMRFERGNHTLQPTALVHEAYVRLADQSGSAWHDRGRILALAALAMRNILVDHARAHSAEKRGAGAVQVTLVDGLAVSKETAVDVLAVDEALNRLAEFDQRQANIMEMHFFAGLTFEEIAEQLNISSRTVKRDWTMARAWLRTELSAKR